MSVWSMHPEIVIDKVGAFCKTVTCQFGACTRNRHRQGIYGAFQDSHMPVWGMHPEIDIDTVGTFQDSHMPVWGMHPETDIDKVYR